MGKTKVIWNKILFVLLQSQNCLYLLVEQREQMWGNMLSKLEDKEKNSKHGIKTTHLLKVKSATQFPI